MKCLTNGCEHDSKIRGLCRSCYNAISYLNTIGYLKYTIQELEEKGLMLKPRPIGRTAVLNDTQLALKIREWFPSGNVPYRERLIEELYKNRISLTYEQRKFIDKIKFKKDCSPEEIIRVEELNKNYAVQK